MIARAVLLGLLAVALAGPCSIALARARWPMRFPAAALLLWQGIGLTGGLALLTGELTLAAADQPGHWSAAIRAMAGHPSALTATGWIGLGLFIGTGTWLVAVLVTSVVRVVRARRAHRYGLDLLACRVVDPADPPVYELAHAGTAAYALPGRRSRIIVSRGARESLSARQLSAVIAHEQAHLRQHHDAVVQPFIAWRKSFPRFGPAAAALHAVEILIEYLADDAARRRTSAGALIGALARLGGEATDLTRRQQRLATQRGSGPGTSRWANSVAAVAAVAIVAGPPAVLLLVS